MAKRLPDANIVETNTYYQGGKWFTEMSVGDHSRAMIPCSC